MTDSWENFIAGVVCNENFRSGLIAAATANQERKRLLRLKSFESEFKEVEKARIEVMSNLPEFMQKISSGANTAEFKFFPGETEAHAKSIGNILQVPGYTKRVIRYNNPDGSVAYVSLWFAKKTDDELLQEIRDSSAQAWVRGNSPKPKVAKSKTKEKATTTTTTTKKKVSKSPSAKAKAMPKVVAQYNAAETTTTNAEEVAAPKKTSAEKISQNSSLNPWQRLEKQKQKFCDEVYGSSSKAALDDGD